MISLLCDIAQNADFAKVNLGILKKLQGKMPIYHEKADIFRKLSKLESEPYFGSIDIHDSVSHALIPKSMAKRLVGRNVRTKESYIPLNRVKKANNILEDIADGIEGKRRQTTKDDLNYNIGRAIRKKKLSDEDKLALQIRRPLYPILEGQEPTKEDVGKIKESLLYTNKDKNNPRLAPKIRGAKPQPQPKTIEEKKQKLAQKYGIR